jgi:hypothetical protein
MRLLAARTAVQVCLVLTLGVLGCGGSATRADGGVTVEPEPDPTPPPTEGDPPPGAAPDAAAPGPTVDAPAPAPDPTEPDASSTDPADPDTAPPPGDPVSPDGGTPDPVPPPPPDSAPPDPGPSAGTCGGVTCPELFDLLSTCRPMGTCTLNPAPLILCYTNGIKIVGESILPPNLVGLVKRADGSDCYRARVSQDPGSTTRTVVWETPDGVALATGVLEGNTTSITCRNVTTPLTDPTCIAVPTVAGCTPGICL